MFRRWKIFHFKKADLEHISDQKERKNPRLTHFISEILYRWTISSSRDLSSITRFVHFARVLDIIRCETMSRCNLMLISIRLSYSFDASLDNRLALSKVLTFIGTTPPDYWEIGSVHGLESEINHNAPSIILRNLAISHCLSLSCLFRSSIAVTQTFQAFRVAKNLFAHLATLADWWLSRRRSRQSISALECRCVAWNSTAYWCALRCVVRIWCQRDKALAAKRASLCCKNLLESAIEGS